MKKKVTSGLLAIALITSLLTVAGQPVYAANTIYATDIVSSAHSLAGRYPYKLGGYAPSQGGFDCTGLIYYIYHTQLGYSMTLEQARSKSKLLAMGERIDNKSDLLPGDIVQYTISHVGIYIGNNTVIHAGKTYGVTKISIHSPDLIFSYGIRLPGIKQDNTGTSPGHSSGTTTPDQSLPTVTSTESGNWTITIPANYKLFLYAGNTSTSSATYVSARSSSYSINCSQRATLSNGAVRYYARFNESDYYWFAYTSGMSVQNNAATKIHTINFNANGGSVSTSYKQVKAGETYGDLPTPTRSGYTFDGWYTAASGGTQVTSSTTVNLSSDQITLYAHWTANVPTYTVKSGSWGVTVPRNYVMFLYNDANSTSSYSSYTTAGPYDAQTFLCDQQAILSDGTIRYATGFFEGDVLVTKWFTLTDVMSVEDYKSLPTYTVSLNANGGSVSPSAITVRQGSTYGDLPQPTRTGYTFAGWYTAATGGTQVKATYGLSVNANHTLYAHWTANGSIASGTWNSVMTASSGSWKLDAEGTLTIAATGTLYKLHNSDGSLAGYEDQIKRVVIEEGPTEIFNLCIGMKNLVSVELPSSLTSIGSAAFNDCTSLQSITIPENVSYLSINAFHGCNSLKYISVSPQNAWYYSIGNVVYEKSTGQIVVSPEGRS